jgi:hypothetical protein
VLQWQSAQRRNLTTHEQPAICSLGCLTRWVACTVLCLLVSFTFLSRMHVKRVCAINTIYNGRNSDRQIHFKLLCVQRVYVGLLMYCLMRLTLVSENAVYEVCVASQSYYVSRATARSLRWKYDEVECDWLHSLSCSLDVDLFRISVNFNHNRLSFVW